MCSCLIRLCRSIYSISTRRCNCCGSSDILRPKSVPFCAEKQFSGVSYLRNWGSIRTGSYLSTLAQMFSSSWASFRTPVPSSLSLLAYWLPWLTYLTKRSIFSERRRKTRRPGRLSTASPHPPCSHCHFNKPFPSQSWCK